MHRIEISPVVEQLSHDVAQLNTLARAAGEAVDSLEINIIIFLIINMIHSNVIKSLPNYVFTLIRLLIYLYVNSPGVVHPS